jgi:hypothetical protein
VLVEPRAFVVVGEDGQPYMLALGRRGHRPDVRYGIEIGQGAPQQLSGGEAPQLPVKASQRPKKSV